MSFQVNKHVSITLWICAYLSLLVLHHNLFSWSSVSITYIASKLFYFEQYCSVKFYIPFVNLPQIFLSINS